MGIHRPNEYLSSILKMENREIVMHKIHRKDYAPSSEMHSVHIDSITREQYYTFHWKTGNAPRNVEIAVETDYYLSPNFRIDDIPKYKTVLHNHDFFEIVYVYSGKCMSLISGKEQMLYSGDICLYNLQAIHRLQRFQPEDTVFNILIRQDLFQRSFLDMLAENDMITDFFIQSIYTINNRAGQIVLHPDPDYHCEELIQSIVEVYYQDKPMSQSMMKALLVLLLGEMTRQYRSHFDMLGEKNPNRLKLSDVISYINEHYESITLEELSAHFGYTTRSMARYFQRYSNTSFKEIVQHFRFHQACSYLQDSIKTIQEIAEIVGYSERSSFERAFKQKYRISPVEYRKRYQNKMSKSTKIDG